MLKTTLTTLWQLPVAIPIWLLYILPAWGLGLIRLSVVGRSGCVTFEVPHDAPSWWRRAWGDWGGHAMPFAIVTAHLPYDEMLDHEHRHVRQWAALGPLFPVVYGLLLLMFGYRDNPLEVDARAHE